MVCVLKTKGRHKSLSHGSRRLKTQIKMNRWIRKGLEEKEIRTATKIHRFHSVRSLLSLLFDSNPKQKGDRRFSIEMHIELLFVSILFLEIFLSLSLIFCPSSSPFESTKKYENSNSILRIVAWLNAYAECVVILESSAHNIIINLIVLYSVWCITSMPDVTYTQP